MATVLTLENLDGYQSLSRPLVLKWGAQTENCLQSLTEIGINDYEAIENEWLGRKTRITFSEGEHIFDSTRKVSFKTSLFFDVHRGGVLQEVLVHAMPLVKRDEFLVKAYAPCKHVAASDT